MMLAQLMKDMQVTLSFSMAGGSLLARRVDLHVCPYSTIYYCLVC
jgi:hypothetical protein